MKAFPNEIAVWKMFIKVCERVKQFETEGKKYEQLSDSEINQLMQEVLGEKR